MTQVRKEKAKEIKKTEQVEDVKSETISDKNQKLKDGMDSMLDEIDSVLEENAQDFINQYVQKGGE
jgi:ubiquitin-like protein Pup